MSPLRPSCQCTLCFGRTFLFLSVNEAGTFTVHDQHSISSAILVPSTRLAPTDDVLRGCPSICWMQVPYLRWRRVGATGWYHRSKLLPDVCPPLFRLTVSPTSNVDKGSPGTSVRIRHGSRSTETSRLAQIVQPITIIIANKSPPRFDHHSALLSHTAAALSQCFNCPGSPFPFGQLPGLNRIILPLKSEPVDFFGRPLGGR